MTAESGLYVWVIRSKAAAMSGICLLAIKVVTHACPPAGKSPFSPARPAQV
jgi:hypothetical protein